MKPLIFGTIVYLLTFHVGFASVDAEFLDSLVYLPINQIGAESFTEKYGYSKDEIIDTLIEYASSPEWDDRNHDNGFRREVALESLANIGSTNDLPRILPLVLDDELLVHNAAIRACVDILLRYDPERIFPFADYVLQLPLMPEDLERHAYVLTCFRWLLADPAISPEIQNGIWDYFRRTRFRDQFCAYETDWFFAKSVPKYDGSDERRNLVALWAASTNALPGIRNYFVGIQRQFFPMDAPPPDETAPASIQDSPPGSVEESTNHERDRQDVQDPLSDAVEEGAPPAAAPVLSPVPDPAAEAPQTPRTNHGTWWIAALVLAAISGVVLKMRHR